jgi:hypothetical protein
MCYVLTLRQKSIVFVFSFTGSEFEKKNLKMDEELQDDIARYYGWRASVELNELNLPLPQGDKFTLHTRFSI